MRGEVAGAVKFLGVVGVVVLIRAVFEFALEVRALVLHAFDGRKRNREE